MSELSKAGGVTAIILNIFNAIDWNTISLIFGIALTLLMSIYYCMKIGEMRRKRRKEK